MLATGKVTAAAQDSTKFELRNSLRIPRALWAASGGTAGYILLARAINNKPFQSSDGRNSPQRRRTATRVEQKDLLEYYTRSRSLISAHLCVEQGDLFKFYELQSMNTSTSYSQWTQRVLSSDLVRIIIYLHVRFLTNSLVFNCFRCILQIESFVMTEVVVTVEMLVSINKTATC